ncbi:MAG: aspartyl/asparaginyl beta-hydroxylase domain-containing protein [Roseibacillus sp.]
MTLPDRLKLTLQFSPKKMQDDLALLEDSDWIAHFVTQNYEGDWDVLPLRGPAHAQHPVMMAYSDPTCEDFADTPFLATCPYLQTVLKSFPFELSSVRLMSLSPGSQIKEHCDHDLSLEDGTIRLHVPIHTNPQVEFLLNDTAVTMHEGECWYLRLSEPHAVSNGGKARRVHLVIDANVTPEVERFIETHRD